MFSGAPARTPWFSSQTIPIGELFTISISPSPSKSMGCIDDAPWPSIRAGSSAAASATMLLRLILEHAATRGHSVSSAAVLSAPIVASGQQSLWCHCELRGDGSRTFSDRGAARSKPRPARGPASRRCSLGTMLDCYEPQGQPNGSLSHGLGPRGSLAGNLAPRWGRARGPAARDDSARRGGEKNHRNLTKVR